MTHSFQNKYNIYIFTATSVSSWSIGKHICFIFGRTRINIPVRGLAILTEDFCNFPQSLQGNTGIIP
jgi:hypothetical protein